MLINKDTLKTVVNGLLMKINSKADKKDVVQKADKKDIMQSDWNQNDETSLDYIKNRPFSAEKNVFFDDTVDFDEYGNCYLQLLKPMPTNEDFSLTIGDITQTISLEYWETDYGSNILDAHEEVIGYIYTNLTSTTTSVVIYLFDLAYEDGIYISLYSLSNIKKIDPEYIPSDLNKLDKINPSGTGSFSMNRMSSSDIGEYSHAEGGFNTASGRYSHAEGYLTSALGNNSHTEGDHTIAHHRSAHVQGEYNLEDNQNGEVYKIQTGISFGSATPVTYSNSYTVDKVNRTIILNAPLTSCFINEIATKPAYFWWDNKFYCIEEGKSYTRTDQLGVIWADNARGKYAHIVGNGEEAKKRSNAYTLDWEGNGWFAGDVYVDSTSGTNRDEGSKKLATEEYIIDKFNSTEVGSLNVDGITDKNRISSSSYILGNGCESGSIQQFVHGTSNIPEGKYTEAIDETEDWFLVQKYAYWTVSDEYTFDENTGLFSLKNPQREYVTSGLGWMGKYVLPNYTMSSGGLISNQARYLYYISKNTVGTSGQNYMLRAIKHYAIADNQFKGNYLHIIGNGSNAYGHNYLPSNAYTLDREGNAWFAGDVYVGSTSGINKDEGSKKLITLDDIPEVESQVFIVTQESANEYEDLAETIYNVSRAGQIVIFQRGDNIYYLEYAELEPSHYASFYKVSINGAIHSIVINGSTITDSIYNPNNYIDEAIANKVTVPQDIVAGDLLTYDGTNWVRISKADLISDILLAIEESNKITFYIEGEEYHADKNMTWHDWCSSNYNTTYFVNYYDYERVSDADDHIIYEDEFVYGSDTIIANHNYTVRFDPTTDV